MFCSDHAIIHNIWPVGTFLYAERLGQKIDLLTDDDLIRGTCSTSCTWCGNGASLYRGDACVPTCGPHHKDDFITSIKAQYIKEMSARFMLLNEFLPRDITRMIMSLLATVDFRKMAADSIKMVEP